MSKKTTTSSSESREDLVARWIQSARSRRITASLILVGIILTSVSGVWTALTGTPPWRWYQGLSGSRSTSDEETHVLAYRTETEIYLIGKSGEPSRAFSVRPPSQPANVVSNSLFWSSDSRYLGAILDTESGRVAWYMNVSTEERGSWECDCFSATFVGSVMAALNSHGDVLHLFDLEARPRTVPVDWPEATPSSAQVLATTRDGVLVSAPPGETSAYGGPQSVYLVTLEGHVERLYDVETNTPFYVSSM